MFQTSDELASENIIAGSIALPEGGRKRCCPFFVYPKPPRISIPRNNARDVSSYSDAGFFRLFFISISKFSRKYVDTPCKRHWPSNRDDRRASTVFPY